MSSVQIFGKPKEYTAKSPTTTTTAATHTLFRIIFVLQWKHVTSFISSGKCIYRWQSFRQYKQCISGMTQIVTSNFWFAIWYHRMFPISIRALIHYADLLPQHSWSLETARFGIIFQITPKFNRILGISTAETAVKFQNAMIIVTSNLAALRLQKIWR